MKLNDKTNMLLQDFPERLEQDEFLELVAENVSISYAQKEKKAKRKNILQTLPQDWFYVNNDVYPLYDIFYDTFYQTFRYRHQENTVQLLNVTKEWYDMAGVKGYKPPIINDFNVDGFSIIGISGIGKTYTSKRILRKCFNQLIHRTNTIQISYLITNCVNIGSLKELLVKFLSEVDRLIGSSYMWDYVNSKNSTEKLEAVVANIGVRHYIGIWIIDEIHHLKSVPFRSAEQIINFFKNVSSVIGMPIVFIGTPEVKYVLGGNFQIARRAEGNGSIFWERYSWKVRDAEGNEQKERGEEWKALITSLWKRQVLRKSGKLTDEIIDAYFKRSQGIMKRLLAIHIRAQVMAMDSGEEKITPELIYGTAKYFQLTDNMISALDSGKEELISAYGDLSMRAFNLIESVYAKKPSDQEIVGLVMNNNFSQEEVVMILKTIMERNLKFMKHDKDAKDNSKSKKSTKPVKVKEPVTGDLIEKVKNATSVDGIYEALKNAGMVGLDGKLNKE